PRGARRGARGPRRAVARAAGDHGHPGASLLRRVRDAPALSPPAVLHRVRRPHQGGAGRARPPRARAGPRLPEGLGDGDGGRRDEPRRGAAGRPRDRSLFAGHGVGRAVPLLGGRRPPDPGFRGVRPGRLHPQLRGVPGGEEDDRGMRGRAAFAATLLFAGLVLLFFWRAATFQEAFFLGDVAHTFYPRFLFTAAAIREGRRPPWDPYLAPAQPDLSHP